MYLTKILSCNGAWDILNTEHVDVFLEIKEILKKFSSNIHDTSDWLSPEPPINQFVQMPLNFETLFFEKEWAFPQSRANLKTMRNSLGLVKKGISIKMDNNVDAVAIFIFKKISKTYMGNDISLPILVTLTSRVIENGLRTTKNLAEFIACTFESAHEDLIDLLPDSFSEKFLIFGIDDIDQEIELIEFNSKRTKVERSIEFKPEHYQAGVGILNYFGTVMRKKHPEQNAKVRIEQDDNTVRLVVESENGDKEIIERAFDEFGLVIHQDIKPEEFYDNYLDVAELKTKLGTFETELKFQQQLVEMKEHRIIELEKDKEFLKNVIGQALVRPNSPIYITNQLHNTQSTVINHKAEFSKSNDELEELIDLADSDALKNRLATIQNALEVNRNADQPEEVKDSSGMKKLAKFLKDANEVGTEANNLATKSGEALGLIKNLGRRYNSIAEWCGMPVIPSILIKE